MFYPRNRYTSKLQLIDIPLIRMFVNFQLYSHLYEKKISASTHSRDGEIIELKVKCLLLKICANKLEKYYDRSRARCHNPDCGKFEFWHVKFEMCSECSIAKYCCKGCQKAHWKKHSKFCKMFQEALRSGSASHSNDESHSNDLDIGHIHKKLKLTLNSDSEGEDIEMVD